MFYSTKTSNIVKKIKQSSHDWKEDGKNATEMHFIGLKKKKVPVIYRKSRVVGSGVNSLTWSRRLSELELRSK